MRETLVKICGNTNATDVKIAIDSGADFIGFIFAKSKRQISIQTAQNIVSEHPNFKNFVGVFAGQPKQFVEKVARAIRLQWLQFHGEETSLYCQYFMKLNYRVIKTFHIKNELSMRRIDEYDVSAYLFDTYSKGSRGGTGKSFDWSITLNKPYVHTHLFLAGGLNIYNVREAVQRLNPFAIDVASGVEKSPGEKDPRLIEEFIRLAKGDHLTKLSTTT